MLIAGHAQAIGEQLVEGLVVGKVAGFDLIANDMRASFQDTPDLAPFAHSEPKQDLFAVNPPAAALKGTAVRVRIIRRRSRAQ